MNVIDSHVHLKHGDAERTEYPARTIVECMEGAGISRSVVFAMSTTTRRSIEMAREAAREFTGRLIPYVYALPHYQRPVIAEIKEAIVEYGFKGIKVHAAECRLTEYTVDPVLELASQVKVPCLFDFCGDLPGAERIASSFPGLTVVVAHMGKYLCTDGRLVDSFIALAEQYRNVYLDVSGMVLTGKIQEAVSRIGAQRLLFGTDGPHPKPDLVSFAKAETDKIRTLEIGDNDKNLILSGTVSALLKID